MLEINLKLILCPIDFSEFSPRVYRHALSVAEHYQAKLVALHVVELFRFTSLGFAASAGLYDEAWLYVDLPVSSVFCASFFAVCSRFVPSGSDCTPTVRQQIGHGTSFTPHAGVAMDQSTARVVRECTWPQIPARTSLTTPANTRGSRRVA